MKGICPKCRRQITLQPLKAMAASDSRDWVVPEHNTIDPARLGFPERTVKCAGSGHHPRSLTGMLAEAQHPKDPIFAPQDREEVMRQ